MIYAVNKRTKEHRITKRGESWSSGWELVQTDPDGWIPWEGGECPLPDGVRYSVKLRDGTIYDGLYHPGSCIDEWAHNAAAMDIIAYRPILDTKPEPPAWDGEGDKPPVGSRCMKGHAEVLVIAHANVGSLYDPAVVYQPINHPMGIDWKVSNVFSPIRSEEDRFVDEVNELMEAEELFSLDRHARALYRAGYRKTGGE